MLFQLSAWNGNWRKLAVVLSAMCFIRRLSRREKHHQSFAVKMLSNQISYFFSRLNAETYLFLFFTEKQKQIQFLKIKKAS